MQKYKKSCVSFLHTALINNITQYSLLLVDDDIKQPLQHFQVRNDEFNETIAKRIYIFRLLLI